MTSASAGGFSFSVDARDGRARAGTLVTPHGVVETPCFMPVGTKATVKAVSPLALEGIGAQIVLANAYHLALRPGVEVVAEHGGLHRFMGWNGPILTDSGGFQVFSLADRSKVRDDGVEFASVYDGSRHLLTPERSVAEQEALGADIIMCFDECPPGTAGREELVAAVDRTSRWAAACRSAATRSDQLLVGIVQGGVDEGLRRRSAAELQEIGFSAYAIGGLSVGERGEEMLATVDLMDDVLPDDRLRYFMGIGDPRGIMDVVARGVDVFDCVLPTRMARTGTALLRDGRRLNLANAAFTRDLSPLDAGCDCPCCRTFSRAYLRHLVKQRELLVHELLTLHNIRSLVRLCIDARAAICAGHLSDIAATVAGR